MVDYWLAHFSHLCDMQDCIPIYSCIKFLMSCSIWLVWIQIVSRQLANICIVFIFIFGGDYGNSWTSQSELGKAEFGDYHEGGFL